MKTEATHEQPTLWLLSLPFASSLVRSGRFLRRAFVAVGLLSPVVLTYIYIRHYGINVPFWDQWSFLEFLQKWSMHTATLADLVEQHNEHRIVFPRLIMTGLAAVTSYNTLAEMYLGWMCVCATTLVIFFMYRKTVKISDITLIQFIPVVALLFSWRQVENWLWGFQLGFFLPLSLVLCCFALIELSEALGFYFLGAVITAGIASFSLASALSVWPIGLWQLWRKERSRNTKHTKAAYKMTWSWGLIGAGALGLYLLGYNKPAHHPSLAYSLEYPRAAFLFFLAVLGSPLCVDRYSAITTGLLLLLSGVYAYAANRPKLFSLNSFWDALVAFAICSAVLLVAGRASLGLEQALAPRYTTFVILGLIGLYVRLLMLASDRQFLNIFAYGLLSAFIAQGIFISLEYGIDEARVTQGKREKAVYILQTLSERSDEEIKKYLFPEPAAVRRLAPFLEAQRLSIFAANKSQTDTALPRTQSK